MRPHPIALSIVLGLVLVACSDGEPVADTCSPLTTSSTDMATPPTIEIPEGMDPPVNLLTCDVVPGEGEPLETGDEITVHFVGVTWSDGAVYDSSWDRDEPFQWQIGQALGPQGWDLGMVGAKVGGRREMIIPPFQAYGADGSPNGDVGPNETLVVVMDVLSKDG